MPDTQAARPSFDAGYPRFPGGIAPDNATVICRCEEVTAGVILSYAKLGCLGPNYAKAFGRSGMGPCQGRYCGLTVTALLAEANGQTPDETGYCRIRPPLKPVTLAELAAMDEGARTGGEGSGVSARLVYDRHEMPAQRVVGHGIKVRHPV